MKPLQLLPFVLLLCSCSKNADNSTVNENAISADRLYKIPEGEHYSLGNFFSAIETLELSFTARFDSSAIYQTLDPSRQNDINKLYGFSDNNDHHHQFSARIGWRWSQGALRLFAYVYNYGEVNYEEICSVSIGQDIQCRIKILESLYIFSVNDFTLQMPRASSTVRATGYRLYPYFGGYEPAPHEISIRIKEN